MGSCPEEVEPLASGTYVLSTQVSYDDVLDVQSASAVYDRESGELVLTYVDADGREIVQELDVGAIQDQGYGPE